MRMCVNRLHNHASPGVGRVEYVGVVIPPGASFPARTKYTPTHLPPPGLRVVTYNMLANAYASTSFAKQELFAACPADALAVERRWPMLVAELLEYHPDVLALQEVDTGLYEQGVSLPLQHHGATIRHQRRA